MPEELGYIYLICLFLSSQMQLEYTAHNTLCLYFPGMSAVLFPVKTCE